MAVVPYAICLQHELSERLLRNGSSCITPYHLQKDLTSSENRCKSDLPRQSCENVKAESRVLTTFCPEGAVGLLEYITRLSCTVMNEKQSDYRIYILIVAKQVASEWAI